MRIAAIVPDLLFGSKVAAMLERGGHDMTLLSRPPEAGLGFDALIVDLTGADVDVSAIGASAIPTLGFYAHVEPATRDAALAAGFDVVVPRSRFAREGVALVERLVADA